jgi:phosphoribosylanthranilate isomerase
MNTVLDATASPFDRLDSIPSPVVKMCGIMTVEHAVAAAKYGADLVGLVFAPSRRTVSVDLASVVRSALNRLGQKPLLVGVFVNQAPEKVTEVVDAVGLDVVQLSGDETPAQVAECARRYAVLKAMRFPADTTTESALYELRTYRELVPCDRLRFLLDTFRAGEYGGTGHLSNWDLAARLAVHEPLVLAGGLNSQNVADAVRTVSPWGVDVSSGIENAGVKDYSLMRAFIAGARS